MRAIAEVIGAAARAPGGSVAPEDAGALRLAGRLPRRRRARLERASPGGSWAGSRARPGLLEDLENYTSAAAALEDQSASTSIGAAK